MNAPPKQPDQIASPPVAATPSSTAEWLVQALTYDIDALRASRSQPGWTAWALLAGGGAIAWALATVWAKEQPVALEVARWSMVLYVGIDLVRRLRNVLSPAPRPGGRTSRFRLMRDVFGSARPQILLFLVESLAAIWLVGQVWRTWPFHAAIVAVGWFGLEALMTALALVFSAFRETFRELAVPAHPYGTKFSAISSSLLVAVLLYVLGGAAYSVLVVAPADARAIRPALLLVALLVIGEILSGEVQDAPLLDTLVELRRNLLVGAIDVEAAAREYDISSLGLRGSDVLQGRIKRLLAISENLRADAVNFRKRLEDTRQLLKAIPQANAAEIAAASRNVDGALKGLEEKFDAGMKQYRKEYQELKKWLTALMTVSADKAAVRTSVLDLLDRGFGEMRSEVARLRESSREVSAEIIKQARSASQSRDNGSDTTQ